MNSRLAEIFEDAELKAKIQGKLPYLFSSNGGMKDDCKKGSKKKALQELQ